jgi:hypothetical protein
MGRRNVHSSPRFPADLHQKVMAVTRDHGRETVARTGRPRKPGGGNPTSGVGPEGGETPRSSLGREADPIPGTLVL